MKSLKAASGTIRAIFAFTCGGVAVAYEIVWLRRFNLLFGHSAVTRSITLALLFCGLAMGGFIWGRLTEKRCESRLLIFSITQIALGFYGLASLVILRAIEALYVSAYPAI